MAFNGSGTFVRLYSWVTDAANGIKIRADRMDNETNGIATGLSTCVTRDGQSPATADLPMGGFKHTNVDDATDPAEYASAAQAIGTLDECAVGGTAAVITLTSNIPLAALDRFQWAAFLATSDAIAGGTTINRDGLGALALKRDGADITAGAWVTGDLVVVRYNGTDYSLMAPFRDLLKTGGIAALSSLALGGATIGSNKLAVTGTAAISGSLSAASLSTVSGITDLSAGGYIQQSFGITSTWNANGFSMASATGVTFSVVPRTAGVILADGGTSWGAISQRHLKKDIQNIPGDVFQRCLGLTGYLYHYQEDGPEVELRAGTMYEDQEEAFPWASRVIPAQTFRHPLVDEDGEPTGEFELEEIPERKIVSLEQDVPLLIEVCKRLIVEAAEMREQLKALGAK